MKRISFNPRYAGLGSPISFDLSDTTGDEARDRGIALQYAARSGMHLHRLDLGATDANGLDLSSLKLTECAGALNVRGANVSGALIELCSLTIQADDATNMQGAGFQACTLDESVFAGAFMAGVNVTGGSLRNVDLTGVVTPDSVWSGNKTGGAKLSGWVAPFASLQQLAGHEAIIAASAGSNEDRALLQRCQWEGVELVKRQIAMSEQIAADEAAGIKSPLIKESLIRHSGTSATSVKTGRFTGIYVGISSRSA